MSRKIHLEDLEQPARTLNAAETADVRGGFSWGATNTGSFGMPTDQLPAVQQTGSSGLSAGKVSMQDFHF